ncbi:MAG: histidine phosphatase family protein [Methylococcales bacterium]
MKSQPRQLWLLRHAKAEPYQTADYERALAQKGIKQMSKISHLLSALQSPDAIISSPALRARQTTKLLCQQLNLNLDQVQWDERIYDAPTSRLVKLLEQIKAGSNIVLLIGHNPGFEGLLEYLTVGLTGVSRVSADSYSIPTATLVQIDMPDEWKTLDPGCASLRDILYSLQKT